MKPTNVSQLITDLGGGLVEQHIASMISDVATAAIDTGKVGEVTLSLKFKRPQVEHPSGPTVHIEHKVAYKRPKTRGSISEDDASESVFHVNQSGSISQFPEKQNDMFNATKETAPDAS